MPMNGALFLGIPDGNLCRRDAPLVNGSSPPRAPRLRATLRLAFRVAAHVER